MGNKETAPKTAAQRQAEMRERRSNDTLRRELIEQEAFKLHAAMFTAFTHANPAASYVIAESPLATLRKLNDALNAEIVALVVCDPFDEEGKDAKYIEPRDVTPKRKRKEGAAKSPVTEK